MLTKLIFLSRLKAVISFAKCKICVGKNVEIKLSFLIFLAILTEHGCVPPMLQLNGDRSKRFSHSCNKKQFINFTVCYLALRIENSLAF